jgi:hypothetical protein
MRRCRFRSSPSEQAGVADTGFTLDLSENAQWPMFVTVGGSSHREVKSGLNQIARCASV